MGESLRCKCGELLFGRVDKKWCSVKCRNSHIEWPPYVRRADARPYHLWTTEQMRFVRDNATMTSQDMAEQIGLSNGQVESFRKRNGFRVVKLK